MKKYARLFSVFALILAITFIFSGCGVIDFAKSILVKDEATTIPDTTIPGDIIYTDDATNSALVTPPSDTVTYTQTPVTTGSSVTTGSTSSTNSTTLSGSTSTTENVATTGDSVSTTGTTAPADTSAPVGTTAVIPETTKKNTSTPTGNKKPSTTAPVQEDVPTVEEIKEMPIKEVQDLLFATEDAQTTANILNACGFEYDEKQGIYYSSVDPWQKNFGFNVIYDMAAPIAGMYYSTERIYFQYDNKDWMIQIWKGQYGMTVGGEIGVYNKTDKIMQYDCVSEDEFLEMSFDLYNQGELLFTRGPEKHWWLTGFKILNVGVPILIDLDMTIKFPTKSMADAFEAGLKKATKDNLLDPMTYTRGAKTFHIHW